MPSTTLRQMGRTTEVVADGTKRGNFPAARITVGLDGTTNFLKNLLADSRSHHCTHALRCTGCGAPQSWAAVCCPQ